MRLGNQRFVLLLLAGWLSADDCAAADAIYSGLVEQGVALSEHETIKLPKPAVADGLDGLAQRQAIESLLAGRYDWEEFTRKSVVSPLLLKIDDGQRASGKVSRRVDLYFVAYGTLELFADDRKLQEQLNLATAGDTDSEERRVRVLSVDELAKRGLTASQSAEDPRWVAIEATLLGKVRINFTTRNEKTNGDHSLLIASVLDPSFRNDAKYPNCWRAISNNDAGRREIGPPQPYAGLGSYLKATRLADPAGAVFVEYHVAYAEPPGWFNGANLLRSKLPIVAQDVVRKLRRKMTQ